MQFLKIDCYFGLAQQSKHKYTMETCLIYYSEAFSPWNSITASHLPDRQPIPLEKKRQSVLWHRPQTHRNFHEFYLLVSFIASDWRGCPSEFWWMSKKDEAACPILYLQWIHVAQHDKAIWLVLVWITVWWRPSYSCYWYWKNFIIIAAKGICLVLVLSYNVEATKVVLLLKLKQFCPSLQRCKTLCYIEPLAASSNV